MINKLLPDLATTYEISEHSKKTILEKFAINREGVIREIRNSIEDTAKKGLFSIHLSQKYLNLADSELPLLRQIVEANDYCFKTTTTVHSHDGDKYDHTVITISWGE